MIPIHQKIFLLILSASLFAAEIAAQPKAAGTTWSFSGIGISYEYLTSADSFADVSVRAEMNEAFLGRAILPGVSASCTWNLIFKSWVSGFGNRIDLFAGTGIMAGWGQDFKERAGVIIGLKGRLGMECTFSRNLALSVNLSPVIGSHAVLLKESVRMSSYKYGLINTIMPEIGIKYVF